MNMNEKALSALERILAEVPETSIWPPAQRVRDYANQAITALTSQPSPDLVGEIPDYLKIAEGLQEMSQLMLDQRGVKRTEKAEELWQSMRGEELAIYSALLAHAIEPFIEAKIASRLAAKGGAVSGYTRDEVEDIMLLWQDSGKRLEAVMADYDEKRPRASLPTVERVSRDTLFAQLRDLVSQWLGEKPSVHEILSETREDRLAHFLADGLMALQLPAAQVSGVGEVRAVPIESDYESAIETELGDEAEAFGKAIWGEHPDATAVDESHASGFYLGWIQALARLGVGK